MSDVVVAEKQCSSCRVVKPITDYHRNRSTKDGRRSDCKACALARISDYQARKRAQMGDAAWLEKQREQVRAHRTRTGNARGKVAVAAYDAARAKLITAHRSEFDALLRIERYERGLE